jgi:hypothetical protein
MATTVTPYERLQAKLELAMRAFKAADKLHNQRIDAAWAEYEATKKRTCKAEQPSAIVST